MGNILKILFLSHRFPYPPTRGDKIRSFNMVKHLHEPGHEVTVASLSRSGPVTEECQNIRDYCKNFYLTEVNENLQNMRLVLRSLSRDPSSMGYFYSNELASDVRKLLGDQKFDQVKGSLDQLIGQIEKMAPMSASRKDEIAGNLEKVLKGNRTAGMVSRTINREIKKEIEKHDL